MPEATTNATRIAFGTTGNNSEALRQLAAAFNLQGNGIFVQIVEHDVSRMPPGPATLAERLDCFAAFDTPAPGEITAALSPALGPILGLGRGSASRGGRKDTHSWCGRRQRAL